MFAAKCLAALWAAGTLENFNGNPCLFSRVAEQWEARLGT